MTIVLTIHQYPPPSLPPSLPPLPQVSHVIAMQRYLGDDLRDHMRKNILHPTTTTTNVPPEYPLEHRSSSLEHHHGGGSMHEMNNGMRIWSAKNESLSSSVSVSEETNVCETNASLDGMHTHVRTSFSDMMDKNHAVQAMEEYISPRTGGFLSICMYIW